MLLTMKKLSLSIVFFVCCICFIAQNVNAEEVISGVSPQDTPASESILDMQSTINFQNNKIQNILMRIETLERQVNNLAEVMSKSLTVRNTANDAKMLATESWDLAVEARAIAVRAEEKADQSNIRRIRKK